MGRHQHRRPRQVTGDGIPGTTRPRRVETGAGFIQQEHRTFQQEYSRQGNAGDLASGKRGRGLVEDGIRQLELNQDLACIVQNRALVADAAVGPVREDREGVPDRAGLQLRALRQPRHVATVGGKVPVTAAAGFRFVAQRGVSDPEATGPRRTPPGAWGPETGERFQERAFAAATGPGDGNPLTGTHRQRRYDHRFVHRGDRQLQSLDREQCFLVSHGRSVAQETRPSPSVSVRVNMSYSLMN